MSKWTLRQQRTRQLSTKETQEHSAALRAARYVRRHAWQFHGVGVADAVRDLVTLMGHPPAFGAPGVAPAECPDCSHAHVEGQNCTASMGPGFCGCTG